MTKWAALFPGQGSQATGMGAELHAHSATARHTFDEASEVLGFDVAGLCFDGPDELLKRTENSQVALYTVSVAAWRAFREDGGPMPDAGAGHSVGEYAALTAAESLKFAAGVKVVRARGELMRDAASSRPGAMLALLGTDVDAARALAASAADASGAVVAVANVNGGGQVVLSGEEAGIAAAEERARDSGIRRAVRLAVGGAFHSPLMVAAGDALYPHLQDAGFAPPRFPVYSNVTAKPYSDLGDIIGALTMQVSRSVLWEQTMLALGSAGIADFVEFGAGSVLCGLAKRIDAGAVARPCGDVATLRDSLGNFQRTEH